jgi:hypothetical protein
MKLIVVIEHRSKYPNPIHFKTGESLKIGKKDSEYEGWIWVTVEDGNQGWAPLQYLQIEGGNKAIAKLAYSAKELDTHLGEELLLHHEINDWGWVEKSDGSCGWVPIKTTQLA